MCLQNLYKTFSTTHSTTFLFFLYRSPSSQDCGVVDEVSNGVDEISGRSMKIMWLLHMVVFCVAVDLSKESIFSLEQRLLTDLLTNYTVISRPVIQPQKPVTVYVTTEIIRIDAISEKTQSLRTKLHILHEWRNELLVWKPGDYGGVNEIIVPVSKIWTPYIHLFNEAARHSSGDRFQPDESYMISITHDGNCSRSFAHYFKSTCEIDVSNFPFDDQHCEMEFGSWSEDHRLLLLKAKNKNVTSSFYTPNGEWHLRKAEAESVLKKFPIQREQHSIIRIKVFIERKYLFFVMNLVVPCALIASMIFLVFLLPPKSGERISLGITVLLSMAIFQELSSEKLPTSSDNFPLLGIYYTTSMFEIGIAMTMNCFVLNLYYRQYDMPLWVRRLVLGRLARLVGVDVPHERTVEFLEGREEAPLVEHNHHMDTVLEDSPTTNGNVDTDSGIDGVTQHESSSYFRRNTQENKNGSSKRPGSVKENALKRTDSLRMRNLRIFSLKYGELPLTQAKKQLGEDWKLAARIIDRVMLVASIVIGVVSALTIFLQAERLRKMLYGG